MLVRVHMLRSGTVEGSGGAPAADAGGATPPAAADAAPPATPPAAATPGAPGTGTPSSLLTPPEEPKEPDPGAAEEGKDKAAPEEEKKADEPPALKPEDYKITLPESIHPEDEILQSFLAGAAKGGMDQESVQSLIDAMGPALHARFMEPFNQWKELNDQWQREVRTDPEIGGDKYAASIDTINRGVDLVMSPEEAKAVREAAWQTGAGNNPHLVRLLHRFASRLVETTSKPVTGAEAPPARSSLEAMYPSSAKRG